MLRPGVIGAARNRLSTLAGVTALAVATAMLLHSPSTPTASAPTDLGGIMAAVAQESSMAASVAGSSDYYLKIEGIAGESLTKGHENQIRLGDFSWGASNPGTATGTGTGAGAGKVKFSDFNFTKTLDKASPLLLQAVASGKHLTKVTLYGVAGNGGKGPLDYLTITLTDVLVSSYQSSAGDVPTDSFALNFTKITFDYRPQNPDGSLGTAVHAGWDVKANKAA